MFEDTLFHLRRFAKVGSCCWRAFLTKHIRADSRVLTNELHLSIEDAVLNESITAEPKVTEHDPAPSSQTQVLFPF